MNRNTWLIPVVCFSVLSGCASWQQADTNIPPPDAVAAPELESAPAVAAPTEVEPPPKQKSAMIPLAPKPNVRLMKSADGSIEGEIVGTPAPNSKFAKLQIGMTLTQVADLIGQPEETDSHVTGRQFQPFYLGGDTQRTEAFYEHEGQLTFSNTQIDSAADTLIRIVVDPHVSASR